MVPKRGNLTRRDYGLTSRRRPSGLKVAAGVFVGVGGVIGALYLGGWVFFVGGIVQMINAIKATPVEATGVAVGLLRVIVSGAVTTISLWLAILVGIFIAQE